VVEMLCLISSSFFMGSGLFVVNEFVWFGEGARVVDFFVLR